MEFFRYTGNGITLGSHKIESRQVFAQEGEYIALPNVAPFKVDSKQLAKMLKESRDFKADPTKLFRKVDLTIPKEEVKTVTKPKRVIKPKKVAKPVKTPKSDPIEEVKKDDKKESKTSEEIPETPKPDTAKPMPVLNVPDIETKTSKRIFATDVDNNIPDSVRARIKGKLDNHKYHKADISFDSGIQMGGTPENYQVMKLQPFGNSVPEIVKASQLGYVPRNDAKIWDAPDYVLRDFRTNVAPALGLNVALPFKRLAFGYTNVGTCVFTMTRNAMMYGLILITPSQIADLMGGYNSKTLGQAVTHELAHFVDFTMLRNSERMRWDQEIRGKDLHPDQATMGARTTSDEHFATLAELMVWGSSARRVFNLNGFEIVAKYFKNRFITPEIVDQNRA